MFSKEIYLQRRNKLKEDVKSGVLVFIGNDECGMNYRDNTYHFRQDSTFLYFFGLNHPGLTAIIDIDENREIVFGDELTIDDIVWMGKQPTLKEMATMAGVNETRPSKEFFTYTTGVLRSGRILHCLPAYRAEHELKLFGFFNSYNITPSEIFIKSIVKQRIYKSPEEIAEIEKACDVTADMHLAAYRAVKTGMREYEIASIVEAVAKSAGCSLSFPTIATVNGQTLHNHYHGNIIKEGDMFLLDAGAETQMGYAGDMSSTICAGKKFTARQKDIYDIQVASHTAAVEALKPGRSFEEIYDLSCRTICEGMKNLGLMKGNPDDAVKEGAHAMFFQCGLGHMMGLDVHDMENLGEKWVGYDGKEKSKQFGRKSLRLARPLEEGFVITIEPGIYFIPELIDLWQAEKRFGDFINYDKLNTFRDFGGLRNEEDFLITENGSRRLGKKIPLTVEEVEVMR